MDPDHSSWLNGHIAWLIERGWWPSDRPRRPWRPAVYGTVVLLAFVTGLAMPRSYSVRVGSPAATSSGFPTPATTGYPAGQSFSTTPLEVDGTAHAVTTDNAVLDGVHVGGDLLIRAANVTIRNSWIEGSVYNDWAGAYQHYEIYDSTITYSPGINSFNCNVQPGLLWSNYIARRVNITGHDDGFRYTEGGPVDIRDSFWRGCWVDETVSPPDGSHSGGIQAQCSPGFTCGSLTMVHNNLDNDQRCVAPLVPPCAGIPEGELIGNSGISVQSFSGNVVDGPVLVQNNLVSGGGYTMPIWWFGGTNDYTFTDNKIVSGQYSFGPVDGVGCAHQTWTGNTLVTLVDEVNYAIASTVRSVDCSG